MAVGGSVTPEPVLLDVVVEAEVVEADDEASDDEAVVEADDEDVVDEDAVDEAVVDDDVGDPHVVDVDVVEADGVDPDVVDPVLPPPPADAWLEEVDPPPPPGAPAPVPAPGTRGPHAATASITAGTDNIARPEKDLFMLICRSICEWHGAPRMASERHRPGAPKARDVVSSPRPTPRPSRLSGPRMRRHGARTRPAPLPSPARPTAPRPVRSSSSCAPLRRRTERSPFPALRRRR